MSRRTEEASLRLQAWAAAYDPYIDFEDRLERASILYQFITLPPGAVITGSRPPLAVKTRTNA